MRSTRDDAVDTGERAGEALAADQVDPVGARDRDDVVTARSQQLDQVASQATGGAGDRDFRPGHAWRGDRVSR